MRDRPTIQPAIAAAHPHSPNPPVTGLKDDPESAALKRSNGRAINPSFIAFLPPFSPVFTVQSVISRTSPPAALRLTPTFATASQQNATVALRSNDTREASPTGCALLIYGTAIKKLRKPTPINEYKLLIYGKPRPNTSRCTPQNREGAACLPWRESSEILIATASRLEFAVSYRRETRKHSLIATRTGQAANPIRPACFSSARQAGSPPARYLEMRSSTTPCAGIWTRYSCSSSPKSFAAHTS